MALWSQNYSLSSEFIILGFRELADLKFFFFGLFLLMHLITLAGHTTIVLITLVDSCLQTPMYFFLRNLSAIEICYILVIVPNMLANFLASSQRIPFLGCALQMHLFIALGGAECFLLAVMAYDRFVAICNPLRYATILTPVIVAKIGGLVVLRGVGLTISFPSLAHRLLYCGSHTIAYTYCEHMAVVKLACGTTTVDNLYAFAVAIFLGVGDVAFIAYSYGQIVRTVIRFPSPEARAKAASTCTAHVCVIIFFYGPGFLSVVMQRFGPPTASAAKVIIANLYLLFPPALDPIVYGAKTKQIREQLFKILSNKGVDPT